MTVQEIIDAIEQKAPLAYQEEWDNSGLQVGNRHAVVTGVLLCTDVTEAVMAEAIGRGCNLVVSHHPLIFRGIKHLVGGSVTERVVAAAVKHDVAVYSAHTSMDNAPGGVSWHMAKRLAMTDVEVLEAHPAAGPQVGCGVVGNVEPTTVEHFVARCKEAFEADGVRYSGDPRAVVTRVALCGGAGAFLADNAIAAGAQVFVSGDMKYHDFLEKNDRIVMVDVGHYESEHFTKEIFYDIIQKKNPNFAVAFAKDETNQIKYL